MPFETTARRIAESQSVPEIFALAMGWFAAEGFARSVYGFTPYHTSRSIGALEDALFLTTEGDAFTQAYFQSGFYRRTPGFRWAEAHVGACTWKGFQTAWREGRLPPEEAEALRINQSRGITCGMTVSFPLSSSRSKGALGLIGDPILDEDAVESRFAARGDSIIAMAHLMHLKLIQMPYAKSGRRLTQRQKEALTWVADGKTWEDIALLMGVSPAMVDKHLRLARQCLAVETTAQAVAKATLLNLL